MFAGSFYFCVGSPSSDKAEFKGEIVFYDIIGIDEFINVFNKALEWGKLNKTEKMFFSKDLIPQGNFSSGHCSLIFNGSDYGTWYVTVLITNNKGVEKKSCNIYMKVM